MGDGSKNLDFDQVVGSNIRQFRTARELSQTDLAEALSKRIGERIHQQTIQKIEKGTRPLKYAEALEVCDILGVGPHELTVGSEETALIARKLELITATNQLALELDDVAERLSDNLIHLARQPKSGTDIDSEVEILLRSNWGLFLNRGLTSQLLPVLDHEQPPEVEAAHPTYLDILKTVSDERGSVPDDESET